MAHATTSWELGNIRNMSGNRTTIQIQFTEACMEGKITEIRRLLERGVTTEVLVEVICFEIYDSKFVCI